MTTQVGPTEQGKLQGALSSLRGVVGMAGPIIFTQSFAAGLRMNPELPGVPYVLAAGMIFLALLISFRTTKPAL
jgi:MFS transporter, DHA1 family, tetracycline resistance protein